MAGFVLQTTDGTEFSFHIGERDLKERVLEASKSKRVVKLQVDGDELEAALWGLENFVK